MTVISPMIRLVDDTGQLTPEGVRLLQELVARTAALETTTADHETRIDALETP